MTMTPNEHLKIAESLLESAGQWTDNGDARRNIALLATAHTQLALAKVERAKYQYEGLDEAWESPDAFR